MFWIDSFCITSQTKSVKRRNIQTQVSQEDKSCQIFILEAPQNLPHMRGAYQKCKLHYMQKPYNIQWKTSLH